MPATADDGRSAASPASPDDLGREDGPDLISRRTFLAGVVVLVGASAVGVAGCGGGPGGSVAASPSRWIAVSIADMKTGVPRWVEFDATGPGVSPVAAAGTPEATMSPARGGAWVVREQDGSVVAFVPRCTHEQCAYDWEPDASRFHCRCHPGYFDAGGRVISGPPPRPLDRFETRNATATSVEIGWYGPGYRAPG